MSALKPNVRRRQSVGGVKMDAVVLFFNASFKAERLDIPSDVVFKTQSWSCNLVLEYWSRL